MLDIPTVREIMEELKIAALYHTDNLDKPVENFLIGAMNVKDALSFLQTNSLMIIPGDRDDILDAICRVHSGKIRKNCNISGVILSGGLMPNKRSLQVLQKSGIPTLVTKDDTYKIASRVNSMVVKLKPQDKEKIDVIINMVDKYLDIDKTIANLK